ncbi:MAG: PD-(D/E)XK nuclease family protein, partial [Gammaproteobacteria bacterium]|nr:PD-(D/E)XK nuclease family protein [Gammaproteobacteria bacterium]
CLDLGSERINAHLQQEKVERLAEQVRLTYVALTRAQLACYGVWGLLPGSDRSGLNWLLHRAGPPPVDVARLKRPTDDHEIASSLATLASDSVTVKDMPASSPRMLIKADSGRSKLEPRALQHEIPRGWRVSSFSALTRHVVEEPRDYDAGKGVDVSADVEPEGIFAFPRGARAGRCMHALFENIAFDATQSEILPVAQQVLREHGYDAALADVLATMAVNVLSTNLDKNKTRLCDVAVDQRVCEMEFYFPTARLNADALRTTLGNFGRDTPIEQRLNTLDFIVDDGFVHGFIDLVFETHGRYYLTDYKSNWLGGAMEDYRIDRLIREISRHDYYLQYLIYSVALHRHLAKRLADYDYDRHFGGAYYLFVRGMQPDNGSGYGVFYDRPDAELMRRLELLFFGQRPGK